MVVPEEAQQAAVSTTCSTAQPKFKEIKEETEELKPCITIRLTPKMDEPQKLVQNALSIWLLRSKLHRKEFRRIAL